MKRKIMLAPGWGIILIFIVWSLISGLYNNEGIIRPLLFSRYIVLGYLILLCIWNTNFDIYQIRQINFVIYFMFLIQIITSFPEILSNNIIEKTVGIMFNGGGGPATTFPLFAFSFLFSFYLYRRKLKYFVIGISFLIIGYASGKIGVYFLIVPISFIGFLFYNYFENRSFINKRNFEILFSLIILVGIILIIIPYSDHRTSKYNFNNKSFAKRLSSILEFAEEGENTGMSNSYTGSRTGTSLRVIEETLSRPKDVFFFGNGFQSYQSIGHSNDGAAFEKYKIIYGITGWTYDAIIYGWPIIFFHVFFYYKIFKSILKKMNAEKFNVYWSIISLALTINFFTFIINYFFYNTNYTIGGWIISIHMYFAAILLSPNYNSIVVAYSQEDTN